MNKFKDKNRLGNLMGLFQRLGTRNRIIIIVVAVLLVSLSLVGLPSKEAHGTENNTLSGAFQANKTEDYSAALVKEGRRLLSPEEPEIKKLGQIQKDIDSILSVRLRGFGVKVNGRIVAVFKTREQADKLLSEIMKPYYEQENSEIIEIKFKENVIIEEVDTELDGYDEFEEVFYYITKGTNEIRIHKVEKGENYWVIADKYSITPDDLIKANPDVEPERLQIGQEISLVVPKPYITVVTKENIKYEEKIPFETEYEETSVLYKGEYRVKKAGENGIKEVEANLIKENGIETDREVLKETVIKEPVTKVVLKGTKNPPPRIGTGTFAKPTSRGYITSRFGWRWGRRHEGIDIGMPVGTPVKAADGGKVIYSGYRGAYGYLVIIDHGANMQTYYAHNSKLLVKRGDKVFKGQTIAHSGNTGRSTGPHLHFEVRKNGTPVNPLNYIKY